MKRMDKNNITNNTNGDIEFPVRVNRYLLLKNYCSRRKADEMIEKGLVKINGKVAVLGQKIQADDKVEVSKSIQKMPDNYQYVLLNKPRGVVSHNPQFGEKEARGLIKRFRKNRNKQKNDLAPVGRLDKDSDGLIFLTNDGRIIDRMLNPKYDHEKEYSVTVDKVLKESFPRKMSKGIKIEGYMTKPAKARATGPKSFKIILTEGKKHQIRRMCAALGYQVKKLTRTRIMNLNLGNLKGGESRPLTNEERGILLKSLGI
jgi:23S rRNA pseudouridine2604 synthase